MNDYNRIFSKTQVKYLHFVEAPNVRQYQVNPWHPLLWTDVRVWHEGRIETRFCSEVTSNERWGRFDGELLPMECIISDAEYAEICWAIRELNHG